MSTTTFTSPGVCCSDPRPNTFHALGRSLYRTIALWAKRGRDVRHLQSLSDNQLSDIGIRRSEIGDAVYGKAFDHVRKLGLKRR